MASIVFGDYEYTTITNGVKFKVMDTNQTSYSDVLEFVTIANVRYPVISAEDAFNGCSKLVQAPTLPDSITNMTRAFYDCTNLIAIDRIPLSVENMTYCFRGCENLRYIRDTLHNVVKLNGCFDGCSALQRSPEIPESALYLNWTFSKCTGINQTIVIHSLPSSYQSVFGSISSGGGPNDIAIATISDNSAVAQLWRNHLSSYAASRNLVMWGDGGYCPSLLVGDYFYRYRDDIQGFSVWVNSEDYYTRNDRTTFGDIPETLPICFEPIYVKDIQGCFYNEENLRYAPALPNSIESMYYCFYGCRSLESVTMPINVTNIDYCFCGCLSLQSISLPNNIESMYYSFSHCTSLKTVNIPTNAMDLRYCFYECSNLCCDLTIPESAYGYLERTFCGCKNLSGNLTIKCDIGSGNDRIFYQAVTSGQLYIINNARQGIKDSAARNWRSVVQNHNNPNIHYETDDHLAPTAQIELKRTDSQGNESSTGDHVLIKKAYTIYSNDIPSGFPISVQRETTTINGEPCTTPSGSPVIYNVVEIGDGKAIVEYTISDNYKTTTITATLSKVMALIDFLGSGSRGGYIDIPGMGMSIGKPAIRNGLDIQFPTAIGEGLLPATIDKYELTTDTTVQSGKDYYTKSEDTYSKVDNPTGNPQSKGYYENVGVSVDLDNHQLIVGKYNEQNNDAVLIVGDGYKSAGGAIVRSNILEVGKNIVIGKSDANRVEFRQDATKFYDVSNSLMAEFSTGIGEDIDVDNTETPEESIDGDEYFVRVPYRTNDNPIQVTVQNALGTFNHTFNNTNQGSSAVIYDDDIKMTLYWYGNDSKGIYVVYSGDQPHTITTETINLTDEESSGNFFYQEGNLYSLVGRIEVINPETGEVVEDYSIQLDRADHFVGSYVSISSFYSAGDIRYIIVSLVNTNVPVMVTFKRDIFENYPSVDSIRYQYHGVTDGGIYYTIGSRDDNYAKGKESIALGKNLISSRDNQIVLGKYNSNNSTDLLVIGNGTSTITRSNLLTLNESGKVTINSKTLGSNLFTLSENGKIDVYGSIGPGISIRDIKSNVGVSLGTSEIDGVNHGVWSYTLNKWLIYGNRSNVYINGHKALSTGESISIKTKEINIGNLAANSTVYNSVSFSASGYDARCIVGWNMTGTNTSFASVWRLYYNQTEDKIYYGVRNLGSSAFSNAKLSVLILCCTTS